MEETIELNLLDKEKLYELKDFLENHQIKGIDIKSKDIIVIKYDKKIIELNKNFKFKVKLIRNKYYRQLLNIINIINNIKIYKYIDKGIFNFLPEDFDISILYIFSNDYKDILKMALINFIGVYNFDNIFELAKDEMLELKEYRCKPNNSNNNNPEDVIYDTTNLLGMYCHHDEKLFSLLESRIDRTKLDKMKECNNFILICPELIKEFCNKKIDDFKECDTKDESELENIMHNKVLAHEIGHGVFDYTDDSLDKQNERRANYFASLTFDGTFDRIIKKQTDIQRGLYEKPILIDDDISTIIKDIYQINK